MTTHAMTQKERLASLESHLDGHAREHALTERVWEAKLDAIDARLAKIEGLLNGGKSNGSGGRPRIARRDVGLAGLTAALTSALWWLAEALRVAGAAP